MKLVHQIFTFVNIMRSDACQVYSWIQHDQHVGALRFLGFANGVGPRRQGLASCGPVIYHVLLVVGDRSASSPADARIGSTDGA